MSEAVAAVYSSDDADTWTMFLDGLRQLVDFEDIAPVRSPRHPTGLADELSLGLDGPGMSSAAVIDELVRIGKATPATASPQFFNQLFGGRIDVATMAEMLSAFLNTSMYTYKIAGPQVLVERTLVDKMCDLAGLTAGDGSFTPGGSLSNMLALVIAREEHIASAGDERASTRRPIMYTSDQGHYSVRKNAMLTGVGRQNLRTVASDHRGRMDPAALDAQIEQDLTEGHHPFFVNLTAGTTVLGAFDEIGPLTAVARRHGLWVHVDGAMGGSLLLSDKHRGLLEGLEDVDSFTWDTHKLMGVPLTSSVCLFRERGLLEKHLTEVADYLFTPDESSLDPGLTSMQCGRRNDALKVWAAWKHLGDEGYADRIDNMMEMANYAAMKVSQHPEFTLIRDPESINVCFTVEGVDALALCQVLLERERSVVGYATVDDVPVVRLAIASPTTHEALDCFFASAERTAKELRENQKEK
jgi:glutamate/tyrosine decarboxylase-like PLP-dependent enzyme